MFYQDENGVFCDIGKIGSKLQPSLPAGNYSATMDFRGNMFFTPLATAADRYVDIPMPEMEAVVRECQEFFDPELKARIKERGQVNKRGVLLWGPPGTGKTRLMLRIMEVAAKDADAVILNGVLPKRLESFIAAVRREAPERPVVVVWDEFDQTCRLDEETLLRWLDGVDSVDNIMFVGCTNHIKNIPARIYARPSRFGLVKRIAYMGQEARRAFIKGSYPEIEETAVEKLAELTDGLSLDMSKEVALLYTIRGYSVEEIAKRMSDMTEELKSAGVELTADVLNAEPASKNDGDDDDGDDYDHPDF